MDDSANIESTSNPNCIDIPCYPYATQPEIVLSTIKDNVYKKELQHQLHELVERIGGTHLLSNILPEINLIGKFLYYGLTTGSGQQTLGEEYCNLLLVQTKSNDSIKLPYPLTLKSQWTWVILHNFVPYIIERSKTGWNNLFGTQYIHQARIRQISRQRLNNNSTSMPVSMNESMNETSFRKILKLLDNVTKGLSILCNKLYSLFMDTSDTSSSTSDILNWIQMYNLALFYIYGKYYEISKRMIGLQYIFNYEKTQSSSIHYGILGYFILSRAFISSTIILYSFLQRGYQKLSTRTSKASSDKRLRNLRVPNIQNIESSRIIQRLDAGNSVIDEKHKCMLCLDVKLNPSVTPCGHVYCWECIISWCQSKPECPLCRQNVYPQTIRILYNY